MKTINIIDFVKKDHSKLTLENFYDVDALVLAQLTYFDYSFVRNKIKLLRASSYAKEIVSKTLSKEKKEDFFLATSKNTRYKHLKILQYKEETSLLSELQFSATSFIVNRKLIIVAFRGTDNTINGWKEDFNLGFLKEIPAQKLAVEYLAKIAKKYRRRNIIIVGHSKGGNLAFYAAMKQPLKIQNRFLRIYNLDGPDFLEEISASEEYRQILPKTIKIVPEESIIGMILQTHNEYVIVKAAGSLLDQHTLFNWLLDDETNNLVYVETLTKTAKKIKVSFYSFINKFTIEEREMIVNSLFALLKVSECTVVSDFINDFNKNIALMFDEYKASNDETKKLLRKSLFELLKFFTINYFRREKILNKKI